MMETDFAAIYRKLLAPVELEYGAFDELTLVPIVGFSAGGPLSFRTIGRYRGERFVTYVSCELVFFRDQVPSKHGRYELMACCDDEAWVVDVLSNVARMSSEAAFEEGDTLDISAWVSRGAAIRGILFEAAFAQEINGESYGILRCIGVTEAEMRYARERSSESLLDRLESVDVYPRTCLDRSSVV